VHDDTLSQFRPIFNRFNALRIFHSTQAVLGIACGEMVRASESINPHAFSPELCDLRHSGVVNSTHRDIVSGSGDGKLRLSSFHRKTVEIECSAGR
jgi:hypothetical protein